MVEFTIKACNKKIITWPNCGPNGGEAEAFPAGIYVRNLPIISPDFFAALAAILKRQNREIFVE